MLDDEWIQGHSFRRQHSLHSPLLLPVKLLSYADDTLLFLHDVHDLEFAAVHLAHYSAAPNAQINFHKTRAISLSGLGISSRWLTALYRFDISHIWTAVDNGAIIYLGYPLVQCIRQQLAFVTSFLRDLKQTMELHAQRSISLYGRATIVNSLVVSKCQYILSVLPIPVEFLNNIHSILTSFVNTSIHPVISWDLMVTAKSQYHLGILDLFAQQKALYYR